MARRFDRITSDPARMNGQPCVRGMRLTVRRVVAAVALCPDREELKQEYPELEDEDTRQALEYAAESIADEIVARWQVDESLSAAEIPMLVAKSRKAALYPMLTGHRLPGGVGWAVEGHGQETLAG